MHGQRDDEQVLFLLVTEWPLFIWKPKEKNFWVRRHTKNYDFTYFLSIWVAVMGMICEIEIAYTDYEPF